MFTLFSRMMRPRRGARKLLRFHKPLLKFESYSQLKNQSISAVSRKPCVSRKYREMLARRDAELKIGTGNLPVMFSRFLDGNGNHTTDDKLIHIRLGRRGIIVS